MYKKLGYDKSNVNKLYLFLKRNKLIIVMFLLSTAYFMYLHKVHLSWDFISYILNAKYWAGQTGYFELLRPPLVPFIMFILSFVGWHVMEYLFIFLASLFFAYSMTRLAKRLTLNRALFYAIALSPFVLGYGLVNGSELIFISFVALALSFIIENNVLSGIYLGLSALARYNTLIYFPFLFLNKKRKTIFFSCILFILVFATSLSYNFFTTGNMFTSMANLYAMNYTFREYLTQPAVFSHFFIVIGYYILFAIIGLIVSFGRMTLEIKKIKKFARTNKFLVIIWSYLQRIKADLIFILIFLLGIHSYLSLPIKNERYLFAIILPLTYYTVLGIKFILVFFKKRYPQINLKKIYLIVIISIVLINIISSSIGLILTEHHTSNQYDNAIDNINLLGLNNCSMMSNSFVIMSYFGYDNLPYPPKQLIKDRINQGENILFFYNVYDPEYMFNSSFLEQLPVILSTEEYILLGNASTCIKLHDLDLTYLKERESDIFEIHGYYINVDSCHMLSNKKELLEKICNFVNFKGFDLIPKKEVILY